MARAVHGKSHAGEDESFGTSRIFYLSGNVNVTWCINDNKEVRFLRKLKQIQRTDILED